MLSSGSNEASQAEPVVAADSTEPEEPPEPTREPEPVQVVEPEPSEAELFYRANLAFESYNFDLREALSIGDWSRYRHLMSR